MINLYWPVYKNLEKEVLELSNHVHFDDHQLSIYSVKIAELLMRCSVEIESISKDLFLALGGYVQSDKELYFDTQCLQLLEDKWMLSKKIVIISSNNFYFQDKSNTVLTPLYKANKRGTSGSYWKQAYQAVKHNRVSDIKRGNIKNLLGALAALFVLNIYYKDEIYDLKTDSQATNFPFNMGSDLFTIKIHKWSSYDEKGVYGKGFDFDECVYLTKWKKNSEDKFYESNKKMQQDAISLFMKHPKFIKWLESNKIEEYNGNHLAYDILGKDEYIQIMNRALQGKTNAYESIEYEAITNKNNI